MGGMALTYDPTTALQNGFYPAPYNITSSRMLAQAALPLTFRLLGHPIRE